MSSDTRRLNILSVEEIEEIYNLPKFNDDDRNLYFDFSGSEMEAVNQIHTVAVAIQLALQLGYFKAKRRFFIYEPEQVQEDCEYIFKRYFSGKPEVSSFKSLSKPTRLEHQKIILAIFKYRSADQNIKAELERKSQRIAMLSTQPQYILREILEYLQSERIITPGYTYLQDLVGQAVTKERNRITTFLAENLTEEMTNQLDMLLQADEHVYRISALKRESRDFSYKELRQEVDRRKFFQPLHDFARDFLANAGLSVESGKYYASLVKFYTVYKMRRMSPSVTRLYLLCFAYHRFRQINDNLIEAFIHLVHQYESEAKRASNDALQKTMEEMAAHLEGAGQVLNLFTDNNIPDEAPFSDIKTQAFMLLEQAQFPVVSKYLQNIEFDKIGFEWAYYASLSNQFKRNMRHLFCVLDFVGRVEEAPLLDAVKFLQDLLRQGKSPRQAKPYLFPTEIIPKSLQPYLFPEAEGVNRKKDDEANPLDVDSYEFLLYRLLRNALEAGNLYVRDSVEFKRFEDDLISDKRWENKAAILQEIGAEILSAPIEQTLELLQNELETKIHAVNQRITDAVNQHIKIIGRGEKKRWTLLYPSEEEPVNSPFYGKLPGIGIADLMWFVHQRTGFLNSFTHVLDRYVKHEPDPRELLACIVAMGTNMGIGKMAEVSGLNFTSLLNTARNFLRLETLHSANDAICNATATLSAFNLFEIGDGIHSSSDGQRIETRINTVNSRHSPKYFGLDKGVSGYTIVANHVPINAKIIGTHEHESHYVFDILYNNSSDIKPEVHSTDTHGTNQVNFFILKVFGYQFAPRYRNLHKKMERLVGFQNLREYSDLLIKPSRKVYDDIIIAEWPNIQRILASLAQKDATQATIVRKLSSYSRQNQTKKALWELDNICRTIYILDYIDDVTLRQSVQKALNRGEAYHRFRKSVAYMNEGKFRVKTETEQNIWNECARLIANAIIYYNTLLLSKVYDQKLNAKDEAAINILRSVSPVAWRHVNMIGKIDFTAETPIADLDALAARYAEPGYWNTALEEDDDDSLA